MSRIGKKPIPVPAGVTVKIDGRNVSVSGPKGNLAWCAPEPIEPTLEDGHVVVKRPDDAPRSRERHGLTRALIANMVHGCQNGYEQKMEVYGTGYGCKLEQNKLHLNCGFMGRGVDRPAQFIVGIPAGLTVTVETPVARGDTEPAKFTVTGVDKQHVGNFCAEVRKIRKPEPYKGKGIRYAGEQVRRKAGKVFAGGG
jgi:large subunit ribosomal protein L6